MATYNYNICILNLLKSRVAGEDLLQFLTGVANFRNQASF